MGNCKKAWVAGVVKCRIAIYACAPDFGQGIPPPFLVYCPRRSIYTSLCSPKQEMGRFSPLADTSQRDAGGRVVRSESVKCRVTGGRYVQRKQARLRAEIEIFREDRKIFARPLAWFPLYSFRRPLFLWLKPLRISAKGKNDCCVNQTKQTVGNGGQKSWKKLDFRHFSPVLSRLCLA